jgi:hypothetical protein
MRLYLRKLDEKLMKESFFIRQTKFALKRFELLGAVNITSSTLKVEAAVPPEISSCSIFH